MVAEYHVARPADALRWRAGMTAGYASTATLNKRAARLGRRHALVRSLKGLRQEFRVRRMDRRRPGFGVGVARWVAHPAGGFGFHHRSLVEIHDAIGRMPHQPQVMADEQNCGPTLSLRFVQQIDDRSLNRYVQRGNPAHPRGSDPRRRQEAARWQFAGIELLRAHWAASPPLPEASEPDPPEVRPRPSNCRAPALQCASQNAVDPVGEIGCVPRILKDELDGADEEVPMQASGSNPNARALPPRGGFVRVNLCASPCAGDHADDLHARFAVASQSLDRGCSGQVGRDPLQPSSCPGNGVKLKSGVERIASAPPRPSIRASWSAKTRRSASSGSTMLRSSP